jgi:hypothetical protein
MKYPYCVLDRDTAEPFSTTFFESLDAALDERNRLALTYGKEFALGIGRYDEKQSNKLGMSIWEDISDLCLDCGKNEATKRQPWRGVWLCEDCYEIDMQEV